MPHPTPPSLSTMHPQTRTLHEGIDANIRRSGKPVLHPNSNTILPDLIGGQPMIAWQEGKATMAFLQETCWAELPPVYARYGTDETLALIQQIRALYQAQAAVVTDCGAQAVSLAIDAVMRPGDHAILARQIYGKSRTYLEWMAQRQGCTITVVDHIDAATLHAHVQPNTRMVLGETFSNPLTRALDPDAVSDAVVALRASTAPDLMVVIDDTIATPWGPSVPFTNREGIDVVVGAGTKAVAGQDQDLMGYIVSNHIGLMNLVMDLQAMRGGALSWRSAKVISEGLEEASRLHATRCHNAGIIAAHLASHPQILAVHHPTLPDHPEHDVVQRAYQRPGSMVSFQIRDLDEDATLHFCNVLAMTTIVRYALSFDGLVTKVNHHRTVSEYFTPAPRLVTQGIDRIVRLGLGVEHPDDIIAALDWALARHSHITPEDVLAWQQARRTALGLLHP